MRKLEDIVPPSRRKDTGSKHVINPYGRGQEQRFPFTTVFIILAVVSVSIGALFYFSSAKVDVTPKVASVTVQSSFTASKNAGDLPFEIISAQKTVSQSVQGSGTKSVTSTASGSLTIYNSQSKSQKLIANTRFAAPSGLIFRIRSAVTVPAGTPAKPGSVRATVYGDQPGASYNIGPTSFTIPGFAGTPQFAQIYARSSAGMVGGASGSVPIIDAATAATAKSALKVALDSDLAESIKSQVPEGYILLPGASVNSYTEIAPTPSSSTGVADVKLQGETIAVVFPNAALARTLAQSVPGLKYGGEDITITDEGDIVLTTASIPDPDENNFTFTVSGTAQLAYTVSSERIAASVAGKTKSAAEVAMTNLTEVESALIILRPFWRQTFPNDPASITVIVRKQ